MAKLPGFIGPSAVSQSIQADAEETYNFYLEPLSRSAKNQAALYPVPGFNPYTSVSQVGSRALFEMNSHCYAVIGGEGYEVFNTQTTSALGAVTQDSNPAQIESNGAVGAQFLFASGTNGYCYTPSSAAFTQVLTGDCVMIGMLDGYFIALNPTTSRIRLSNLNDGTTWSSTQFAARSDAPDNWAAMVVSAPDIWLIGQQTGCVYYDAGTFPFPLAPRPGANFKWGIVAPWSLKAAGGSVMWLARNKEGAGVVVLAVGYSPQKVSTPEMDTAIAGYASTVGITDAEATMFQFNGHTFYALTFPKAGVTWVYDLLTSAWVKWGKWNSPLTAYGIWSPRVHCYAFGVHLVGERTTGTISVMDDQYMTEMDGSYIRRMRITPAMFSENRNFPIRKMEVFLESGLGTVSGQGFNPKISVGTSDDGGKTYLPDRQASAGKMGEYPRRVFWTRMGIPRNRVNRFVMTDPIPWRLIDAYINTDAPPSGQ